MPLGFYGVPYGQKFFRHIFPHALVLLGRKNKCEYSCDPGLLQRPQLLHRAHGQPEAQGEDQAGRGYSPAGDFHTFIDNIGWDVQNIYILARQIKKK